MFGIEVEALGLDQIDERIRKLEFLDTRDLLEGLGAEIESQTRRRIHDLKTSPDGVDWKPWSGKYSETRHENQSLLISRGDLEDSITHEVSTDELVVGSNLIYAATHQYGDDDRGIPERPYLGLSMDDEIALTRLVVDFLDETIR